MTGTAKWKRLLVRGTVIVFILFLLAVLSYCWGAPLITGQVCYDFVSGHVPPKAMDRFLDGLFEATVGEDLDWLATVSSDEALEELRAAQPFVTTDYEVLLSDDLIGFYERRVRFDNGAVVYIHLYGVWPTCPDFIVTDEEIFQNIELVGIKVESE
jgi:hypothetical protein